MKKIFLTMMAVIISTAAFAQGNDSIMAFCKELESKGFEMKSEMVNMKNAYTIDCILSLDHSIGNNKDVICGYLHQLAKTAYESYFFESHKNGMDTIKYSICLKNSENGKRIPAKNSIRYYGMKEAITFEYYKQPDHENPFSFLRYSFVEKKNADEIKEFEPFNMDEYEDFVKGILERNGVKAHKVDLIHDENTPLGNREDYFFYSIRKDGHSTGIVFSIPCEQREKAEKLLNDIFDSSRKYLSAHKKHKYWCKLSPHFEYGKTTHALMGYGKDCDQNLLFTSDENGFHFFLLRTKGALWIPKDILR